MKMRPPMLRGGASKGTRWLLTTAVLLSKVKMTWRRRVVTVTVFVRLSVATSACSTYASDRTRMYCLPSIICVEPGGNTWPSTSTRFAAGPPPGSAKSGAHTSPKLATAAVSDEAILRSSAQGLTVNRRGLAGGRIPREFRRADTAALAQPLLECAIVKELFHRAFESTRVPRRKNKRRLAGKFDERRRARDDCGCAGRQDRKSTRLNSSHVRT